MRQSRFDIHQHITAAILKAIDAGPGDFHLPWHRSAGAIMRPRNALTEKSYQGVNILGLWAQADVAGFSAGLWATFKQWHELGASVRKGAKASYVVFYKEYAAPDADEAPADGDAPALRRVARATPVFAAEQVDGFTIPVSPLPQPAQPVEAQEAADAFVAATAAQILHAGQRAFYRPADDTITLPPRETFVGSPISTPTEAYYATLLHELTHWTAPASRCNRELGKRFGDAAYAAEELIAELGAAFLCADLSVSNVPRPDHAQYLNSWLSLLKADSRAIFAASAKASEAVAYLQDLARPRG